MADPQAALFAESAQAYMQYLSGRHNHLLAAGADHDLLLNTQAAKTLRRAIIVHQAILDISAIPTHAQSQPLRPAAHYLTGVAARMHTAMHARDIPRLNQLTAAASSVLDGLADAHFDVSDADHFQQPPIAETRNQTPSSWPPSANASSPVIPPSATRSTSLFRLSDDGHPLSPSPPRSMCGLSCAELGRRDKLVLWLYLFMVIGAIIAVAAVTVDFARQAINPGSFIQSEVSDSLPAPVVTVCLSQRGVPFSRLQLFNFTDAQGRAFVGADPQGEQEKRQSKNFKDVVERFWDNPDNEDCDDKLGDFYPFPLQKLNLLTSGQETTACRPCYRVGSKKVATATSTSFQNSSILSFWTDNYFLQCMKRTAGLNERNREFLYEQLAQKKDDAVLATFSSVPGVTDVADMTIAEFSSLNSRQLCNAFYFSIFPRRLEDIEPDPPNIGFIYNGTSWNDRGNGPFFELPKTEDFFPEESLQMFVGTNASTPSGELQKDRDMILIGPNTQTYATFRPVIVYGNDRYDISSSTTNLREDDVTAIFGYWLRYRIFYNYVRFVTDEWYRESTYPASQWIVDLTGYATLFTGASLFSLLLLPLLRTMRRREKQRLLKQRPEVYVWTKHRKRYQEGKVLGVDAPVTKTSSLDDDGSVQPNSMMLPGYNL